MTVVAIDQVGRQEGGTAAYQSRRGRGGAEVPRDGKLAATTATFGNYWRAGFRNICRHIVCWRAPAWNATATSVPSHRRKNFASSRRERFTGAAYTREITASIQCFLSRPISRNYLVAD